MYIVGNLINLVFFFSPKQGSFLYTLDIYYNDVDICVVSVFQCAFGKENVCGA